MHLFSRRNKKNIFPLFLFILGSIGVYVLGSIFKQYQISYAQTSSSFIFTAVGDFGADADTTAVLQGIAPTNSQANFNLGLGDLSYGVQTPETAWCDNVKSIVGETFPFELISGNHESNTPAGYNIDNFATCLPDRIGNITGTYAREYYFDYPTDTPLARFILVSPELAFLNESTYMYTVGSNRYNWVANAIDAARAAGIQWVVVGMHKNCITVGEKTCSMGPDLLNLLVDKKVDLILQGHDHTYQRSKQLSHNAQCSNIAAGSYNPACISDDGADGVYSRGLGSVLTIVGSGGHGLYNVSSSDSEAGYFSTWMGSNFAPTFGFLRVQVSADQMLASYIPRIGDFSDTFIITAGTPPSPTNIPTATPTPVGGLLNITRQVSTSADDAEEAVSSKAVTLNSTDLELGADGSIIQTVGMRFTNVSIPQSATINSAAVEFEVDEVSTAVTSVTLKGQASDNALPFVASTADISARQKTAAIVPWNNVPAWDILDIKHQTPNIAPIIQEIVNRPGWVSGNALVLLIDGTGRRTAEAYDGEPPAAPKLIINYSTEPTSTPAPTDIPTPTLTPDPSAPTPTDVPPPTVTPLPTLTPLPLPTPSPAIVSLNPVADTTVRANNPNTNYGTTTTILVDGNPVIMGYLKFDLSSLAGKTVTSAKLRIRVTDKSSSTQIIKLVTNTTWGETTMTYNNRPTPSGIITSFVGGPSGVWKEIDITNAVAAGAGQLFSFVVDSTGSDGLDFSSRESSTNKPALVIQYQ